MNIRIVVMLTIIALAHASFAQERDSEVKTLPVVCKVKGLDETSQGELQNRIKSLASRADLDIHAQEGQLTIRVKQDQSLPLSELKKVLAGKDQKFQIDEEGTNLQGRVALKLNTSLASRTKLQNLQKGLLDHAELANPRLERDGSLGCTINEPGITLTKLREALSQALEMKDKEPIVELTLLAPRQNGAGSGKRPGSDQKEPGSEH